MAEIVIGVKQFHTDFTHIAELARRGKSFLVVRHRTPLFRVEPPLEQKAKGKVHTLQDLANIRLKDKDPNLSKHIDRLLY